MKQKHAKTWKPWFNSFESLQIFIFNVHFDHENGIFIKVTKGHRSSIKAKEVPCVDWTKHYLNHGYMCQLRHTILYVWSSTSSRNSTPQTHQTHAHFEVLFKPQSQQWDHQTSS
jgi:hypothetical protein